MPRKPCLRAPKSRKRTSAKSGDFDEDKSRVYEAALAEPDVLHFPPLNLPQASRACQNFLGSGFRARSLPLSFLLQVCLWSYNGDHLHAQAKYEFRLLGQRLGEQMYRSEALTVLHLRKGLLSTTPRRALGESQLPTPTRTQEGKHARNFLGPGSRARSLPSSSLLQVC